MKVIVTKTHQVVKDSGSGTRRIIVMREGDRIDGTRQTDLGAVEVQEVTNLKRVLGDDYQRLVKDGILVEEPD